MPEDQGSKKVYCVRNRLMKDANEHASCPYCFGKKHEAIEKGERSDFCDFNPDKDPISFGFPEDSGRNSRG
ncbi:MAG: hypothetical protein HY898_22085 [Deltaproteobacteria bacterium]|nr:hypothetical protein [Deltaproteobacteria bacterium]